MGKSIDKEEVVSGGASGLCQGHQGEAAGVRSQESSQREVGVAQYLGTRGHLGGRVVASRGRSCWMRWVFKRPGAGHPWLWSEQNST